MKITQKFAKEVKRNLRHKKCHDADWWALMQKKEAEAVSYALYDQGISAPIKDIVEEAKKYMEVNT